MPSRCNFKSGFHSSLGAAFYAAHQTFTAYQWSKLEKSGAIFLPASGSSFFGTVVSCMLHTGDYWSATEVNGNNAYTILSC